MPGKVRVRRKGEGGKRYKIVEPSGRVVGQSSSRRKAHIPAGMANRSWKRRR